MRNLIPYALALATLAVPVEAAAQSVWMPPDILDMGVPGAQFSDIVLIVNPSLDLEPVTAAEVLGPGPAARDTGFAAFSVSAGLRRVLEDPSTGFTFNRSVARITDYIFRAWVRNARGNLSDVQIEYSIVSPTGIADRFEHAAEPGSFLPARAEPLGPWEVFGLGAWRLIQAGGRFELGLENAKRSGPHEGTLVVTVYSL